MASPEHSKLPLPASFTRGLADFQKRLSAEQIEEFRFATFQSLQEAIHKIQKEQAQRQSFRNLNKIRPFVDGLVQYSKIIELFINMQPLLAAIWGPIKFCLQVASKLNEAFDTLLDAYERIGSALPIIQAIDNLFYSQPHVQQVLANVFEDILTFHKRAIVFFNNKTWKLTFRLTFHTFADLFGDVLKNLERSRDLLLQSASIAHFQEAQEARIQFTQEFKNRVKREKQEQRLAVIEWLSADQAKRASSEEHMELRQRRAEFPLTTQWLFNIAAMRGWLRKSDASSPTFWLSGIPGAGKTVLFSSVVDKIGTVFSEAQVIYFYCKCSDHRRRTFEAVTRTLIVQILDLNPECLDYLYEKMITSSERHPNSPHLLQEILEKLCANHDLLFMCIDGLDECDPNERSLILSLIARITKVSRADQSVRFFVTGRKENDIEKSLSSAIRLNIKAHHMDDDILIYIKAQMAKLRERFAFPAWREHEFQEKLSSRPQGMFLLARLILDNLLAQENLEDFEEEMDSDILPNGIDQAYDRILVRLCKNRPEKSRQRAKFILEIIISATRTLQSHEIQGALSIRVDNRTIDFDRRRSRTPLGEVCGPIVEVHSNGVIDMIHPTAKSYLLQHHSGYFINLQHANLTMAELCVTYLTFHCFDPTISDLEIQEHTKAGDYSFQEYATCNWIRHVESAIDFLTENVNEEKEVFKISYNSLRKLHVLHSSLDESTQEIVSLVEQRAQLKSDLLEFRKSYSTDSILTKISNNAPIPYLLLQISRARASIEQFSVVPFFENRELFLSAYGIAVYKCPILTCPHFGNGFTTRNLRDAHYQRHERLFKCEHEECDYSAFGFPTKATLARHVRLCHEAWTDQPIFPKISRRPIDKALNDAIEKEDLIAVRTLAMELLDLQDAPAGFLMRSIKAGKRNCARLLIEILGETKEMDHQDSSGTTALHMLVQNADEELLSAMLATSVNVNTQRKHPSGLLYTPLQFATVSSSIAIVRLLLQHRHAKRTLTANKASVTRRSILSWAVNAGSGEILKLLLETGWEIFRDGTDILDALEIAIGSSQKTLVGTLLVWGRVLGVETRYPSPYIDWILPDLDDMVPVFMGETTIDAAWEPSKKKCEERIRNATLGGDITRMRLLLRATGVHHISCKHGTVLTIAALYGNIYTVQMLISKGEDISQTVNDGSSAFENAAAGGHEAILQLLLDNGANINEETRDLSDGTALQCAAANGHCSAVGFLLKLGAKIDRHGKGPHNSEAALIKAAGLSSEATALLLLQHGADASAKNLLGESVLHVAAKKGHEELVIQLIKSGAAVDELTAGGDTVLMFAAENGLEEATRLLLEHEVVNHQIELQGRDWIDADGYKCSSSALFRATSGGHFKVVELLLQAGAWASVANELGQTPLAVAKQNGHDFIVALLHSYGVPRGTNYSRFPTGVTFHE